MARLRKTLADYLVIAVSPALIMVLIGSLVYFLLDVFYSSQHEPRLKFILGCFIFAAVLIGRISIEMGMQRAMMYAAPLALLTAIALNRFVEFQGPAAAYSFFINIGLMALAWYSAHKLTWDCTMVDEDQDASGEGLLQRLGLDKTKAAPAKGEKPAEPEGVTGREDRPRPWWERLKNPPPRPHSPGASIVWFSLGALALFGLGQRFIGQDVALRRGAFGLLLVFVACALGLLLTTSFLGLRRYLRQRRLQMPTTMAGLWIFIGCALIVGVLGFAALLPRPNPEYAISEVPWKATSPERGSSRYAMGRDAAEKEAEGSPTGQDQEASEGDKKGPEPKGGSEGQKRPDAQGAGGAEGKSGEDRGKGPSDQGKSGAEQGKSGTEQGKSGTEQGKSGTEQGKSRSQQGKGKGETGEKGESGKSPQEGSKGDGKDSSSGKTGRGGAKPKPPSETPKRGAGAGSAASPSSPSSPSPGALTRPLEWLGPLLKWLLYAALVAAAAYWLWRSRHELGPALRRLLAAWRDFWSWLFGGKKKEKGAAQGAAQQQAPLPRPRRFADFVDPFAAGIADRYPPDELVRYSFEALEAWARENGLAREPDQTPLEFTQQVRSRVEALAADLPALAGLYYQAAYARGTLSRASVRPLARFWASLRAQEAVATHGQEAGRSSETP